MQLVNKKIIVIMLHFLCICSGYMGTRDISGWETKQNEAYWVLLYVDLRI